MKSPFVVVCWIYFLIATSLLMVSKVNAWPDLNLNLRSNLNSVMFLVGFGEQCSPPFVRDSDSAINALKQHLKENLFGQHVAQSIIIPAIKMHLDDNSPNKALVFSLHGWAGSGKTYTTQLVIKSLYEKGGQSDHVKFFSATYHFPDPEKVLEYKETLKAEVVKRVKRCERSLFVFDEVDKFPVGLLDVLKPMIKPGGRLEDDAHFNKAIFIFLSNSGATKINEIVLKKKEEEGSRESLNRLEFEAVLSHDAFTGEGGSEGGGLYKSELIDKALVDFFVPFLPLEKEHVKSCARRDFRTFAEEKWMYQKYGREWRSKIITEITDELSYWPEDRDKQWFSKTGCKRVESLVRFYMTQAKLGGEGSQKREL